RIRPWGAAAAATGPAIPSARPARVRAIEAGLGMSSPRGAIAATRGVPPRGARTPPTRGPPPPGQPEAALHTIAPGPVPWRGVSLGNRTAGLPGDEHVPRTVGADHWLLLLLSLSLWLCSPVELSLSLCTLAGSRTMSAIEASIA